MRISIIVARAANGVIGVDGMLPWERQLPRDKVYFMEVTAGQPVIMGRKTFESIPARFRPLRGRTTIVLSRDRNYQPSGCVKCASLQEAFEYAGGEGADEVFVAGGAGVYIEALADAERVYMTHVGAELSGDTHFPLLDGDVWEVVWQSETFPPDNKNVYTCQFVTYQRRPA